MNDFLLLDCFASINHIDMKMFIDTYGYFLKLILLAVWMLTEYSSSIFLLKWAQISFESFNRESNVNHAVGIIYTYCMDVVWLMQVWYVDTNQNIFCFGILSMICLICLHDIKN